MHQPHKKHARLEACPPPPLPKRVGNIIKSQEQNIFPRQKTAFNMKSIAILAVASVAAMASAEGTYSNNQPAYSGGYYPNNQYCQVKVCTKFNDSRISQYSSHRCSA